MEGTGEEGNKLLLLFAVLISRPASAASCLPARSLLPLSLSLVGGGGGAFKLVIY